MKRTILLSLALIGLFAVSVLPASAAPDQPTITIKAPECPTIESDTTDAPELKEWATKAEALCKEWYPKFALILGSEETRLPKKIKVIYSSKYDGVAATGGDTITCSVKWVKDHPEDIGFMLHELTHFQQSYPQYDPVWLVEGISDYVRWFVYEAKDKRPKPNPDKASAKDSYRTTSHFLNYLTEKYDPLIVRKLSISLKENRYSESYFQELTGKSLDDLNKEWLNSIRAAK